MNCPHEKQTHNTQKYMSVHEALTAEIAVLIEKQSHYILWIECCAGADSTYRFINILTYRMYTAGYICVHVNPRVGHKLNSPLGEKQIQGVNKIRQYRLLYKVCKFSSRVHSWYWKHQLSVRTTNNKHPNKTSDILVSKSLNKISGPSSTDDSPQFNNLHDNWATKFPFQKVGPSVYNSVSQDYFIKIDWSYNTFNPNALK